MMIKYYFLVSFFIIASFDIILSQKISNERLQKEWSADWITVPDIQANGYGVYLFRKELNLTVKPSSFVIHLSADNRYKFYVNEKMVSLGPARGDLSHWNYETADISSHLEIGRNILSAIVWNEGEWRPEAQITYITGFILQGESAVESIANTNETWKCTKDESYSPIKIESPNYYVAGAGEIRKMELHPFDWKKLNFKDNNWKNAKSLFKGKPKNVLAEYGTPNGWQLMPSSIPQMESKIERIPKLASSIGIVNISKDFPSKKVNVVIPKNTQATLLLDQQYLTNAYPHFLFSKGKNAKITLSYAEALYSKFPSKGNRNETQGKVFLGRRDSIISSGANGQEFIALTYRTYRYLEIKIVTESEDLLIDDIYGESTAYPFNLNAKYDADNEDIYKIMEIGWRTAKLCATETYMDCPYYEQLQYIGDTRIQALVSLYNSGDDRLIKNAINQMDYSRQPEGVTLSRHPSYTPQFIPTFSLWYIGMLQDYMNYGKDTDFVKGKLGGVRQILDYFAIYQQLDGSLKNVPQWMFTDWVEEKGWQAGRGPVGKDGSSAMLDFQLLLAYQVAADLEEKIGIKAISEIYKSKSELLTKTIKNKYWSKDKLLFSDTEEKEIFSQHTNILAILTGVLDVAKTKNIGQQLKDDKSLTQASIYFKYYLHQALIKAGYGNDYFNWLDKWRENISMGMTTWAEMSDINNSRSDCHAWGASPNIEFFRTILGIESDGIGFSKVKIIPHLGSMKKASGEIPHPNGQLSVSYLLENDQWNINIFLPKGVSGYLMWKGEKVVLKEGRNLLKKNSTFGTVK